MPVKSALKSRIIDDKDRDILMLLQKDGRMPLNKIAKSVHLSIDAVHRRMNVMMEKGIFFPRIDIEPRKLGFPLVADIKIKLKNVDEKQIELFVKYLREHPRCIELFSLLGDYDFTCVLIAKDSNELSDLSTEIRKKFKDLILEWKGLLVLKTYKFEEYDLIERK